MYKNRRISFSLLLIFALFIFFVINVEYASCEENFEVEIIPGFNGYAKFNHLTPFKLKVKNNGEEFNGKIKILLQENYGSKRLYTSYSKNISIAKGTTKTFNIDVLVNRSTLAFKIRIVDKKDNVLWKDVVYVNDISDPNDLTIGILSDDTDSLNYFGLMTHDTKQYGKQYYKTVDINGYVPEKSILLNTFDVIVINNYDTGILNQEQIAAIEEWVKQGGMLIVGTGPNYEKTLRGLKESNFINVRGLDKVTDLSFETPLTIVDGEKVNGIQYLKNGEKTLVFKKELGAGNIFLATFDLGLKPFISWEEKEEFIDKILKNSLNYYVDGKELIDNFRLYRIENIIRSLPFNKLPSLKFIVGIILAFILSVGPINYIILKKIDKREFGWITIPSLTIIFVLIIYFWGFGTRFNEPLVNNVSIIQLNETGNIGKVNSVSGIVSFINGVIDIKKKNENDIFLVPKDTGIINLNNMKDEDVYLEYINEKDKHIIFKNASIWQVLPIRQDKVIEFDQFVEQQLWIEESKLVGNITNKSNILLEDVVIIIGNGFIKIGDLGVGESKEINFDISNFVYNTTKNPAGFYGILDTIYPLHSGRGIGNENNDILNNTVKREILSQYYDILRQSQSTYNMKLIAWSRKPILEEIYVNDKKTERLDRNLFIMPIDINYKKGSNIDIPYGMVQPEIIEMNNMRLQFEGSTLFSDGKGSTIFAFKPDTRIEVNTMVIKTQGASLGNITIYNYKTNQWDECKENEIVIDESNKKYYLDKEFGTRIKINVEDRRAIQIPQFSLKGVVK